MATFTAKQYGQFALHLALKRVGWTTDDIRLLLLGSGYTPNQDTHDFADDLTSELATAGGYTVGGIALANKTATYDGSTNITKLDSDDITISSSTLTWRTGAFVNATPGTAATNPLLGYNQGDADTISTGGATTITMNVAGIFTFTAA